MLEAVGLVVLGASLGAAARFLITHYSFELSHHHGFPYGTLIVNVLGSFLVGWVLTWSADHAHDRWRLIAATGFCGGFTTFSAFAYESMAYLHTGQHLTLLINVLLNNTLSFAALILGVRAHQLAR
jgi:CrcB protein